MAMVVVKLLVFACGVASPAEASGFLKTFPQEQRGSEIRKSLLDDIELAFLVPSGTGTASKRVSQIEATLAPIYAALPKNQHGNVEHTTARYGLYRLFVARNAWVIKGLAPNGGAYNTSSPAGVLNGQVPSYVEDLFEERLEGKGFKLHELAVLAAIIDHLIQEEGVGRLAGAFSIHAHSPTSMITAAEADDMLDTYMAGTIASVNLSTMNLDQALRLKSDFPDMFPQWHETQQFVRSVRQAMTQHVLQVDDVQSKREAPLFGFGAMQEVRDAVDRQWGDFVMDFVCKSTKSRLMALEYHDTGSVRLSEFYKPALDGHWGFSESVAYLREVGVLEESDPKNPRVMIANYMTSLSNCMSSSGLYATCCKSECDDLLGNLEQRIVAPEAKPETIAALIADMSTPTVLAPRNLSATMLQRLHEIAATHGGMVPLHGRLFSQWMHHAFPRECPYPHMSGTTRHQLPEEWTEATGDDITVTEAEKLQFIKAPKLARRDVKAEDLMTWSPEEELLVVRSFADAQRSSSGLSVQTEGKRSILLVAIAGSLAYALIHTMKITSFAAHEVPQKFCI